MEKYSRRGEGATSKAFPIKDGWLLAGGPPHSWAEQTCPPCDAQKWESLEGKLLSRLEGLWLEARLGSQSHRADFFLHLSCSLHPLQALQLVHGPEADSLLGRSSWWSHWPWPTNWCDQCVCSLGPTRPPCAHLQTRRGRLGGGARRSREQSEGGLPSLPLGCTHPMGWVHSLPGVSLYLQHLTQCPARSPQARITLS